jgi:hypothetical protein
VVAGRSDLAALCLNYLGLAYCDLGLPGGVDKLRQSIDAACETGDYEAVARGYTNLAEMLYRQCRWDELEHCLRDGIEFACDRGFGSHTYNLELHSALLSMRRGDWSTAEDRLRRLIDSVDDRGMLSVLSSSSLGRLLARRGDPAAEALLSGAWDRARQQRSVSGLAYAATAYVEWAWLNDRPEVAEAVRDSLADLSLSTALPAFCELSRYLARAGVDLSPSGHTPTGHGPTGHGPTVTGRPVTDRPGRGRSIPARPVRASLITGRPGCDWDCGGTGAPRPPPGRPIRTSRRWSWRSPARPSRRWRHCRR